MAKKNVWLTCNSYKILIKSRCITRESNPWWFDLRPITLPMHYALVVIISKINCKSYMEEIWQEKINQWRATLVWSGSVAGVERCMTRRPLSYRNNRPSTTKISFSCGWCCCSLPLSCHQSRTLTASHSSPPAASVCCWLVAGWLRWAIASCLAVLLIVFAAGSWRTWMLLSCLPAHQEHDQPITSQSRPLLQADWASSHKPSPSRRDCCSRPSLCPLLAGGSRSLLLCDCSLFDATGWGCCCQRNRNFIIQSSSSVGGSTPPPSISCKASWRYVLHHRYKSRLINRLWLLGGHLHILNFFSFIITGPPLTLPKPNHG